jgi:anaerobic selenocysteine-containing dehydrogenase
MLDQSRIGAILTDETEALRGGPPVTAMLIQNTNPVSVAPDQETVKRGFGRDDLFVCVHEQFMTDTAKMADVVLPATMFVEHDDFYTAGGSQYILFGPKLIEAPGECRSNHDVICGLAKRLGAEHPGFDVTPRELIDATLQKSGWGTLAELEANRWIDCQPDFATAHYLNGFAYPDGKFRFKPDWRALHSAARAIVRCRCRHFPIIGMSSRKPTRSIRSASPPRRRAVSSIPASRRRRPRLRASSARRS